MSMELDDVLEMTGHPSAYESTPTVDYHDEYPDSPVVFRGQPIRPTQDAYFLDVAEVVSSRGTCGRLRVGAVLVSEGQIIATGYNGAPAGMPHCQHDDDSPCTVSVHAEANVLIQAARHGRASDKALLYLTHAPCFACAGLIINAGIRVVRYATPYRNTDGTNRLSNGRVYNKGGI